MQKWWVTDNSDYINIDNSFESILIFNTKIIEVVYKYRYLFMRTRFFMRKGCSSTRRLNSLLCCGLYLGSQTNPIVPTCIWRNLWCGWTPFLYRIVSANIHTSVVLGFVVARCHTYTTISIREHSPYMYTFAAAASSLLTRGGVCGEHLHTSHIPS